MKSASTNLNRIKIKDLMAAIKQDIDINKGMGIFLMDIMNKREQLALQKATDDDVRKIEKVFIEKKLGIRYYPSQNKKTITKKCESKIVSIDQIYGSENS